MHFVTGGAFNGKRSWVYEAYNLKNMETFKWISAYETESLPSPVSISETIVILEGVERWIKKDQLTQGMTQNYLSKIEEWCLWEKRENKVLIIIGTDISKGIVPIQRKDRDWRDETGRVYQNLASHANRVDVIWYGLNQQLK